MSRFRGVVWLGVVALLACSSSGDPPPPAAGKPAQSTGVTPQVALDVPLSCADVALENEWGGGRCETGGNGACGGLGVATSDCERCCPAPRPGSCEEIAQSRGWAGFACEQGDGACNGFGEASSDCEVCCEAPKQKPTSAQVAIEWGFEQVVCEKDGNGACDGVGPSTSDCAHVCDAPPAVEQDDPADVNNDPNAPSPFEELDPPGSDEDPSDAEFASLDLDAPTPPEQVPVDEDGDGDLSLVPPPPPMKSCSLLATEQGWPNPICDNGSKAGRSCQGQGTPTSDCDLCCAGEATTPTPTTYACGDTQCLRVAELDLEGVSSPKELARVVKRLKSLKVRPMVVGLQNATSKQRRYVAKQLGLSYAQPPLDSDDEGTLGLLAVAPLVDPQVVVFPEKDGKVLVAEVSTRNGAIQVGTTSISSGGKLAAAQVVSALGDDGVLLMARAGSPSSASYQQLTASLLDGWNAQKWGGSGATRDTYVLRSDDWDEGIWGVELSGDEGVASGSATLTTQDSGASKKRHGKATLLDSKPNKKAKKCKPPISLRDMAKKRGKVFGAIFRTDTEVEGQKVSLAQLLNDKGDFVADDPNAMSAAMLQARSEMRSEANLVKSRFSSATISEYVGFLTKAQPQADKIDGNALVSQLDYARIEGPIRLALKNNPALKLRYHPLLWDNPGENEVCLLPQDAPDGTKTQAWGGCPKPDSPENASVLKRIKARSFQLPLWLINLVDKGQKAEAQQLVEQYETAVVKKYKDLMLGGWVVVNEAIGKDGKPFPNTLRQINPDKQGNSSQKYRHIGDAFRLAKKNGARSPLIYNDYGCEFFPASSGKGKKTDGVYQMVKELVRQGAPIDGVGFQTHVLTKHIAAAGGAATKAKINELAQRLRNNIRRYAKLRGKKHPHGVDVYITEVDIQGKGATDETRKYFFEAIAGVCATEKNCKGVTFWGASDQNKWTDVSVLKGAPEGTKDLGTADDKNQLYSGPGGNGSPDEFVPNPLSYCSAVNGFKAGLDQSCSGWSSKPPQQTAKDTIYQCSTMK